MWTGAIAVELEEASWAPAISGRRRRDRFRVGEVLEHLRGVWLGTPTALASATCVIGALAAIRACVIAAVPGPHLRTGVREEVGGAIPARV